MTRLLPIAERALLLFGIVVAAWCAAVLVEARFTSGLGVPAIRVALPGDATGKRGEKGIRPLFPVVARGAVLARLDAPSLQLSTAILEGTDDGTLSRGAGHIEGTPLPGEPGNIGIAGHRDTVFRPLRNVKSGDAMTLTTADRRYRYRVARTLIVDPQDVYVLNPTGAPTLTLVTCYPFEFIGNAPRRFIVQAELVGEGQGGAGRAGQNR